jgi:hypothetical protein
MKPSLARRVTDQVADRAHSVEPQGDGAYMVLIRLDEIVRIVKRLRREVDAVRRHSPRKGRRRVRRIIS